MKEALRLHPTLPLLVPHCPSETCTVGGYTIPKGARVFVNVWAIQHDPTIWETLWSFLLRDSWMENGITVGMTSNIFRLGRDEEFVQGQQWLRGCLCIHWLH